MNVFFHVVLLYVGASEGAGADKEQTPQHRRRAESSSWVPG